MNKNNKHITQLIEDSLRKAINEAKSEHVDGCQMHFKRIVFNADHNLVVVEIGQEQQRDLPESFFENNATRQALLSYSNCSKVDVMDLGESSLIYFWMPANERDEKTGSLDLAYAI